MTHDKICEQSELLRCPGPVLIVAAHPDDEVIGVGGHLHLLHEPWIVHTTDGAPRATVNRSQYAAVRRQEIERAVALAGITPSRLRALGTVDQESVQALAGMSDLLAAMISEIRPYAIVTHPYEGGHPDHDAAAFAVVAAVKRIAANERWAPVVIEFASYHNATPLGPATMRTGEFLSNAVEVEEVILNPDSRARKQQMMKCFASQQEMLAKFPVAVERFRYAPAYDFTQPPHEGQLFYEGQQWGVGEEWRHLAAEALQRCD